MHSPGDVKIVRCPVAFPAMNYYQLWHDLTHHSAASRWLREQVRDGAFRADLYHRLSVYPVPIPPLRERGDDVLLLAGRFLELNRTRLGIRSLRLSASAQDALKFYATTNYATSEDAAGKRSMDFGALNRDGGERRTARTAQRRPALSGHRRGKPGPGALRLRPADIALAVDDLALEIGLVDDVELHDAQRANPRRREVHQSGTAEAARADAQHAGVLQSLLPRHPDVGDDEVAAVAADLVGRQAVGGLHERRQ